MDSYLFHTLTLRRLVKYENNESRKIFSDTEIILTIHYFHNSIDGCRSEQDLTFIYIRNLHRSKNQQLNFLSNLIIPSSILM